MCKGIFLLSKLERKHKSGARQDKQIMFQYFVTFVNVFHVKVTAFRQEFNLNTFPQIGFATQQQQGQLKLRWFTRCYPIAYNNGNRKFQRNFSFH